ncbi:uncharacterized protein WM294_008984 isoform 1-T1 [Sarcoramphus papa]
MSLQPLLVMFPVPCWDQPSPSHRSLQQGLGQGFRFLNICHNLLGLPHVAEFKLVLGSPAFLTEPAGFWDLRAAFFRLREMWVNTDREAGLRQSLARSSSGQTPLAAGAVGTQQFKVTCGTGWVKAIESR